MSAYICDPKTFGLLGAVIAGCGGRGLPADSCALRMYEGGGPASVAIKVAGALALANIESVAARYPNDLDGNRPGPAGLFDYEICEQAAKAAADYVFKFPQLDNPIVDVFKISQCFDCQSSEVDDWETNPVRRQIERLHEALLGTLPGYDDAPWGWEGEGE